MGSEARDELLSTFFQLAGGTGGTSTGFGLGPEALSTAAATVAGATVKGGGAAKTESNADGGVTAGSVAKSVLESGLGIVPLVTGLFGLFGARRRRRRRYRSMRCRRRYRSRAPIAGGD